MIHAPFTLSDRTIDFSKGILAFSRNEKPTFVTRPLLDQPIRSATAIGANYAEANNAASRTDFRNKIFIAKKEAAKTTYWLSLFNDLVSDKQTCSELLTECHYLLITLQKIINTLNYGKQKTANTL